MDVQGVKERVDIVDVIWGYIDLKKVGRNYKGLCPFHGERTPSFVVHPETQTWRCYGGCQESGDVISFVMKYNGWDFKQAVAALGGDTSTTVNIAPRRAPQPQRAVRETPLGDWRASAAEVVRVAEGYLWGGEGERARTYLNVARGLWDDTIREHRLGFIPGRPDEWVRIAGLSVPSGVLIPHFVEGEVWALKVRRAAGSPKYVQVKGGTPTLYMGDRIREGVPVVIDEGEFNALTIEQSTNLVVPVALGSASNIKVVGEWLEKLLPAGRLYVRMDDNRAGKVALASLQAMSKRFVGVGLPAGYDDPNSLWTGDKLLYWQWLRTMTHGDKDNLYT